MLDFKCKNTDNRVVINEAPFKDAIALKNALLSELVKYPLGLKLVNMLQTGNKDVFQNFLNKELDFTECFDFLKNVLISSDVSEDLNNKLFNCLKYCTYNTMYKIDDNLFDEVKDARLDYYEIIFACVRVNLYPFFKSLVSELSKYLNLVEMKSILNATQAKESK